MEADLDWQARKFSQPLMADAGGSSGGFERNAVQKTGVHTRGALVSPAGGLACVCVCIFFVREVVR